MSTELIKIMFTSFILECVVYNTNANHDRKEPEVSV